MGQVFTWEAVRESRVPELSAFPVTAAFLGQEARIEPSILGLLAFGSVVREDHTFRSDLDCFILYDHEQEDAAFRFMQTMSLWAKELHVPLGFVPCDSLTAQTRLHHVGESFRRHLEKSAAAGGLLKSNPLPLLAPTLAERDELEGYLRVKLYNLQEAYALLPTFSEERQASYLKKLLEAPMHVARKTLGCLGLLTEDSKAFIRAQYKAHLPVRMAEQLETLLMLDESYTAILKQLLHRPDEEYYKMFFANLCSRSEEVLAFIRANLALVATTAR